MLEPQNPGVRVHFVAPDTSSLDGYCSLGAFRTRTAPRQGEVVTLGASLGAEPQRFRVLEVVHQMPPLGPPGLVVEDVTVVVAQICTAADLDRIVTALCDRPVRSPAESDQESTS